MFYITDKFSQFSQLTYHNLESGEDLIISSEIPWDVDGFAMSEDGKRAAFVVNENGYSTLYLLDPKSFQFKKVNSIPLGLIGGMQFDKDNKRLGLTINTRSSVGYLCSGSEKKCAFSWKT